MTFHLRQSLYRLDIRLLGCRTLSSLARLFQYALAFAGISDATLAVR